MTKTIEHPGIKLPPEIVDDLTRREFLIGAGLIALAPYGCGEVGSGEEKTLGEARTIRSKYGEVEIEGRPGRVVTLDNQCTDDALALGVTPVGMANVFYVPGEIQSWTKQALGGTETPELIDTEADIPYERVAELRPDVILASHTWQLEDERVYELLAEIAPTVHFAEGPNIDSWQQTMRRVGETLGQEERAEDLIAETERDLSEVRERGVLKGKTVTLFNADPNGLYAINDPQDFAIRFLEQLGMRLSPRLTRLESRGGGRANISPERYELLDSDLVIGTAPTPEILEDLERDELFSRVPAVRDGRYVPLSFALITSIVYPSLLSVRFALNTLVPRFERAVRGRRSTPETTE
jgi:iron complex transport system substrate-binding protein